MHLNIKKLLATISATVIAVTALSGYITTTYAVDKYPTSGKIGNGAEWFINSDNVLVIYGDGEMTRPSDGWVWNTLGYTNEINEIVIENGITTAGEMAFYYLYNSSKITLPPSLTKVDIGWLDPNPKLYKNLKDIYLYSSNISDFSGIYTSYSWSDSEIIWHVNKNSTTEESLKNDLHLTDENIKYITDDDIMPTVQNRDPIKMEPLTETSGPSGLNSKWEYTDSNKTLTFSGTGAISLGDDYKKYAKTTEHIVMESGITSIKAQTGFILDSSVNISQGFYGFTELQDVKLSDTLKEIGESSFYETPITSLELPPTLETIGRMAFTNSNLEEISFPVSLKDIGEVAFKNTKIKSINLHEGMTIGGSAFLGCESLKEINIPKNILFYRSGLGGQGMAREHSTFSVCTGIEKVTIEDGSLITDNWSNVQSEDGLPENFFLNCSSLKTVIIKGNVEYIPHQTFKGCSSLTNIYLYNTGLTTITAKNSNVGTSETGRTPQDSFDTTSNPTFYIYKDSTTETTLKNAGYLTNSNTVYLATKDDIDKLENSIKSFDDNVDTSKYTEDYAKDFNDALENGKDILNKYNTDNFSGITLNEVNDVLNVLNNIKYKPADYTAVDAAIEKVPADLSKYTEESVKKLQDALDAVNRNLDINSQETVDNYAKAIEDAIKGLVQKTPATTPTDPTKSPSVRPTANVPIVTAPKTRSDSEVTKDKAAAEKIVKQAKITKLKVKSKAKKKITVTWKKVKKAVGYEVQVSKKKNFKKNIFDKFTSKKKITFKKKLKSGKTYYVRVRAYATYKDKNGVKCKVYSKWNKKLRKVKVK